MSREPVPFDGFSWCIRPAISKLFLASSRNVRLDDSAMKVGELARISGVSVRTLHHYGEVGLLPLPARNSAGHRVYGAQHIARLQQILALKQLGLGLRQIQRILSARKFPARLVIEMHLADIGNRIVSLQKLHDRLKMLAASIRTEQVSMDQLIQSIEEIHMAEKIYTKEQVRELHARREQLGGEGARLFDENYRQLVAEIREAMDRGIDPKSEHAQALATRWQSLVQTFTGGDLEIEKTLYKGSELYQRQQKEKGTPIPDCAGYMLEAIKAMRQQS
jgi:DNA-binding transcriptional MerR regulator